MAGNSVGETVAAGAAGDGGGGDARSEKLPLLSAVTAAGPSVLPLHPASASSANALSVANDPAGQRNKQAERSV